MKRRWAVEVIDGGVRKPFALRARDGRMELLDRSTLPMRKVCDFKPRSVKVEVRKGKSKSLFSVDQRPAYWAVIVDEGWNSYAVCARSAMDARSIERWVEANCA